jgi:hypothetical protein
MIMVAGDAGTQRGGSDKRQLYWEFANAVDHGEILLTAHPRLSKSFALAELAIAGATARRLISLRIRQPASFLGSHIYPHEISAERRTLDALENEQQSRGVMPQEEVGKSIVPVAVDQL